VTLESRPPNLEGRGEITIRHLVRNALRMRPDRLILGEVRGSEALDLLMALNTGHDGSLSTIHANGPRDALARLETMTLMAGTELPLRAVREQVASAVQIVLHQERARDGRRRITHISEITGLSGDILSLQEIFRWDTAHNALCATGIRPACTPSLSSEWLL
jgi:pilus assembly protein CpaF